MRAHAGADRGAAADRRASAGAAAGLRDARSAAVLAAGAAWRRCSSLGDGAVASHASAARLWNFVYRPKTPSTSRCRERRRGSSGVACTARRSCPMTDVDERVGYPVHELRADALRLHDAALARSSSDACSTTGCGAATRRSLDSQRCAARLDSGPGRRLGVDQARCSPSATRSFDPGGSASELHVLQVIRDAGLPDAGPAVSRSESTDRTYVLDFAWPEQRGVRRVLRARRALGCERRRVRQRAADARWSRPGGVRSSSPTPRPTARSSSRRAQARCSTDAIRLARWRSHEAPDAPNLMGWWAT